eukprot:10437259-Alexandrium_andersonii.AAC.1
MTLLSTVAPGQVYSGKHWEFDAVEVDGQWAGAIATAPQNSRRKVILYNPELYSGDAVGLAAKELWKAWGNFGDMWLRNEPDYAQK